MKKNKLILKVCLGSLLPIFTIPIVTSVSGPMIDSSYIYFQGRKFNNTEEALKYLVQNNKVQVGNKKVLGDVERSYINMETGQLNKDLLPNYDVSKMNFAYNTAGGGLTQDYKKAKRTYFNKGMILKRYDDGYGNSFLSSRDASNSMRNKTIESKLGFVNVDYVNYDGKSLIQKKLNPFNEDDISNYKKNIKENIFNILADNISNYDNPKLGYKVKVKNIVNTESKGIKIDISPLFKDVKIQGWNNESNETGVRFTKKQNNKIPFNFTTKTFYTGYGLQNERFKGYLKAPNGELAISGNDFDGGYYFEGNRYPCKLKSGRSAFVDFVNKQKFSIQTKDGSGDWSALQSIETINSQQITEDAVTSISDGRFITMLKDKMADESILEKLKKGKPIFKNKVLRKAFFPVIKKNLDEITKKKITNYYQILTLPEITVKHTSNYNWQRATKNFFLQFQSQGDIKYRKTASFEIPRENTKISNKKVSSGNRSFYMSLVSYLLSLDPENQMTDTWLTISRNGRDLFEVKLMLHNSTNNQKKSGISVEIKKADSNHKNVSTFNADPKVPENQNPQKFFYKTLKKLKLALTTNENSSKKTKQDKKMANDEAAIFKEFFENDGYFGKLKNDPRFKYDADFTGATSKTEEKINFEDMIKLYINIISDVYHEYHKFPKILKRISKNIIDPEHILIVNDKNGISTSDLTLGKYMIKSISDFNAPVSNGTFSTDDLLATSRATWSVVKNNVDFNPTLLIIVYDQNGERVNSDDYDYDDETILEFNSRLISEPRRNFEWIYVDGHHGPVENITTTIQYVTIDDHTLYFKTFRQLKEYMLKYILNNSTRG